MAEGRGVRLPELSTISGQAWLGQTWPVEIEEGMVFALETYCPANDGRSAARIEEEIVVTKDGPQLLTLFPAEELVVTNAY